MSKVNKNNSVESTNEIVIDSKRPHRNKDLELSTEIVEHLSTLDTKSAKIRYLLSFNFAQSSIARYLKVKDQFVSNVKRAPLKKAS